METLSSFIQRHKVRFRAEMTDSNPHMEGMVAGSTHWRCVISCRRARATVYFSMGPALCREPSVEDVLDCLASDAAGFENAGSFKEWASEYGYDSDSRRAEKTYRAIERQYSDLYRLFGDDGRHELMFETERL